MLSGKPRVPQGGGLGAFGGFTTSSTTLSYLTPPPDFSSIPQDVVVPFKNLSKKASATKEKALQDILVYLQGLPSDAQTLEESVIDAYVELYPRLSIDDSARVRELSHQLLFHLLNTAKKRISKRLPRFVGPWLAGTFDRDTRVSRAAKDALSPFLQTKEKEGAFWKAAQNRALEFAIEAIKETPDTLSDERSTTKQDSEAKYHRVVGASLSLVSSLMRRGDLAALKDDLSRYLETQALWTMSKSEDSFVRRVFYQFLITVLEINPEALEARLPQVGRALIADGLKQSQAGSTADLLRALTGLTKLFPQVWGTQKHPLQRLEPFISRGSQGGAEDFWRALDQLLQALPETTASAEVLSGFLGAMRKGIADRLEFRPSRHQAFQTYAHAFELFLSYTSPNSGFLDENLSSLTRQYLHPTPELSSLSPQRPDFLARAWMAVSNHPNPEVHSTVTEEWQKLTNAFLTRVSTSLPEVSDGYRQSQTAVASEGERWFALASKILSENSEKGGPLRVALVQCSTEILRGALELLTRRNFKPLGAASVLQSAFRHCPGLCAENDLLGMLFPTEETEIYRVIVASPSLPYLVSDLNTASGGNEPRLEKIWNRLVENGLQLSDPLQTMLAIKVLIAIPTVGEFSQKLESLQSFLVSVWGKFTGGEGLPSVKDLSEATLAFDTLSAGSTKLITADIVSSIGMAETSDSALFALEVLLQKRPDLLPANHDLHVELVTNLLALTEVSGSVAERARSLRLLLDQHSPGQNPAARIIENHLNEAGPSSLEYATLCSSPYVRQAISLTHPQNRYISTTGTRSCGLGCARRRHLPQFNGLDD